MNNREIQHIAFAMDGNRRWATKRGLPQFFGHTEGAKTFRAIVKALAEHRVPYGTFYTLSTENLQERSQTELQHLFSLFEEIPKHLQEMQEYQIRLRIIGDITKFPEKTVQALLSAAKESEQNSGTEIALALNYGSRDELVRAIKKLIARGVKAEEVSAELLEQELDTRGMPPVDLFIRTGGRNRLSNFLLWQSAYAEIYTTDTLWPDFNPDRLLEAIEWFGKQQRNFGK